MNRLARPNILVVEDDIKIAKLLRLYLESAGYKVHSELQGGPALRYATRHRPDLVILDLRLPDLNGYEVCRRLRERYPSWALPILMLTGMDTTVDRANGMSSGADAYVTKPFEPPQLLPMITTLLGKIDPIVREKESPPDE